MGRRSIKLKPKLVHLTNEALAQHISVIPATSETTTELPCIVVTCNICCLTFCLLMCGI